MIQKTDNIWQAMEAAAKLDCAFLMLGHGKFALIDKADLQRAANHSWCYTNNGGCEYARCGVRKKHIYLHHFIFGINIQLDHKNRNGLDCRRDNLRKSTQQQNRWNSGKSKTRKTTSKFKGVIFDKWTSKWQARCSWLGKTRHLGRFVKELDAARAYRNFVEKHFGQFSCSNAY